MRRMKRASPWSLPACVTSSTKPMSVEINIRNADEGDIPFILACEARPGGAFVQPNDETTHRNNLQDTAFTYLIAESADGKPLGYAIVVDSDDGKKEWRRIIIEKPGDGIGKRFMTAAIDRLFDKGATAVWLDVFEDNERAHTMYEKMGFQETRRQPEPGNPDRTMIFMELTRP